MSSNLPALKRCATGLMKTVKSAQASFERSAYLAVVVRGLPIMPGIKRPGLVEAIVGLLPLGLSQRQIAERVGCSQSYVAQVVRMAGVPHHGPRKVYDVAAMEATIREMALKGHSKRAAMVRLRIGWERLTLLLADMPDVLWRERGDTLECRARQAIPKVITGFIPGGKKRKRKCLKKRRATSRSSK